MTKSVCIGGSFNPLHKGHRLLIKTAIHHAESEGHLFIGLTSDEMIKQKENSRTFNQRLQALERFLDGLHSTVTISIEPLNDPYGPSINGDYDTIIVTEDTLSTAERINIIRKMNRLPPLEIITIPLITAEDGKKLNSTRIRNGEVDSEGRVLTSS